MVQSYLGQERCDYISYPHIQEWIIIVSMNTIYPHWRCEDIGNFSTTKKHTPWNIVLLSFVYFFSSRFVRLMDPSWSTVKFCYEHMEHGQFFSKPLIEYPFRAAFEHIHLIMSWYCHESIHWRLDISPSSKICLQPRREAPQCNIYIHL